VYWDASVSTCSSPPACSVPPHLCYFPYTWILSFLDFHLALDKSSILLSPDKIHANLLFTTQYLFNYFSKACKAILLRTPRKEQQAIFMHPRAGILSLQPVTWGIKSTCTLRRLKNNNTGCHARTERLRHWWGLATSLFVVQTEVQHLNNPAWQLSGFAFLKCNIIAFSQ